MQCTSYHNFLHKKNPYLHALQGNGEMGARYTDPDGRELYIEGDDDYRKGVQKYLQTLTNDKVSIDGNGKVTVTKRTGILGFFYNLFHKSKPVGTALLRAVSDDDYKKCTISQSATNQLNSKPGEYYYREDADDPDRIINASNGVGVDCAISFDPTYDYSKLLLRKQGITQKNQTVLAHELIHGYYDITGGTAENPEDQAIGLQGFANAIFTENKIRQEQEKGINRYRVRY